MGLALWRLPVFPNAGEHDRIAVDARHGEWRLASGSSRQSIVRRAREPGTAALASMPSTLGGAGTNKSGVAYPAWTLLDAGGDSMTQALIERYGDRIGGVLSLFTTGW